MTYDELKKVEDRVPSTPEQMVKPLAEALDPGMAFAIVKAKPLQFLVRSPEEKRKLMTKVGISAAYVWTLAEGCFSTRTGCDPERGSTGVWQ